MEKLEGKYFENTISKLKEAKNSERIEMRTEFKANLRATLVERATLAMPEGRSAGWSDMIMKWKYLFSAVPVLAVLVLVVTNVANYQLKMSKQEFIPQNVSTNNDNLVLPAVNNLSKVNDNSIDSASPIVTFSAESVMPPADVMAKIWSNDNSDQFIQPPVQTGNTQTAQPLSFNVGQDPQIKLVAPNIDISNFDFQNNKDIQPEIVVPARSGDYVENVNFAQTNSQDAAQTVNVVSNSNVINENQDVISPDSSSGGEQANLAQDNISASVQSTALTNDNGASPVVDNSVQAVPQSFATMMSVDNSNSAADSGTQLTIPLNKTVVSPVQDNARTVSEATNSEIYLNANENVVDNSVHLNVPSSAIAISNANVLNPDRINYDGEDRPLVVALVIRELADKNGNFSPDYSVKVEKLKDGQFKIVLFEFGKVSRIDIMQKNLQQEYRTVTVVNY